jgi:hypothetical protein
MKGIYNRILEKLDAFPVTNTIFSKAQQWV